MTPNSAWEGDAGFEAVGSISGKASDSDARKTDFDKGDVDLGEVDVRLDV